MNDDACRTAATDSVERLSGADVGGAAATDAELRVTLPGGPGDVHAWAQYVAAHADGTVFHDPCWSLTVRECFGHQPMHLLAWRGARLVGVLPLMEVRSLLAGRLLISVPYGTYGGILADDDATRDVLASTARELAEASGARVLELRSRTAAVADFEPIDGYLGFSKSLPATPDAVAASLPKRPRAAARHARDRDGVQVVHDPELLEAIWHLYCRSMRRLASVNYPLAFFRALQARLGDDLWVSAACRGGELICGTLCLVYRDTIMPYILGADERITGEGAANLLYWDLMARAVQRGLHTWDYGRSRADNRGAVGFKKNQGFEPSPLGYQAFVPGGRRPPNLKPSNPRFALARRVWTRLPLAITRPLGAWLSRSLPG